MSCRSAARLRGLTLFAAMLCVAVPCVGQSILHVDDDAVPGGDGLSWASAFRFIQDATNVTFQPGHGITEIRVAQGTYRPDRDELNPLGTGNRAAVFHSVKDVQIKGGYAGIGAPDPDRRDVELYETILTGDLNGDDGPNFANNAENSYHVVSVSGSSGPNRLLDGFTITGGNANGAATSQRNGGGVTMLSGTTHVTLSNCRIVANRTTGNGGGVYNPWTDPTLIRCTIAGNEAESLGGGMYSEHADPTLSQCTFNANSVLQGPVAYGGGMYVAEAGNPTLTDCTFVDNTADAIGGGLYNTGQSHTTLHDCTFRNCSASSAGAINNTSAGTLTMVGCTFVGNSAGSAGAVLSSTDCAVTATNCRFLGNEATNYGAGALDTYGTAALTGCLFSGNQTVADGGAVRCLGSGGVTTMANCSFGGNTAGGEGGGVHVFTALHDISVSNSVFWGNVDSGGTQEPAQLRAFSWGAVSVDHSSVQNWTGVLGGTANDGDNPLFADADGNDNLVGTDDDDLRLSQGSLAINGGDPNNIPPPALTDLDGHARVLCGRVDRGAYESGIGDFDCNGSVNLGDFLAWLACETGPGGATAGGCEAFDFDADGAVDIEDFAAFQVSVAG